jgi:hypothetical protein
MEIEEEITDSITTCIFPLRRMTYSMDESLENAPSGLLELHT